MKINLKQPKYVIAAIIFPFLFLFFQAYKSLAKDEEKKVENKPELKTDIGGVSDDVKNKDIGNKLEAFKDQYRDGDGYTAVNGLTDDQVQGTKLKGEYNALEKRRLDSVDAAFKEKYGQGNSSPVIHESYNPNSGGRTAAPKSLSAYQNLNTSNGLTKDDQELAKALTSLQNVNKGNTPNEAKEPKAKYEDPMALFREQMKVIDSVGKANDPDFKAQKQKEDLLNKIDKTVAKLPKLDVVKATTLNDDFNTVQVAKKNDFIKAIIDQSLIGYADSRVRIRLLEDIKAGKHLITKGTYIYALISGFEGQRVKLTVTSVMTDDKLLPVKLEIYDLDGMEGLYVPESNFRTFTKDISDLGSSVQIQQDGGGASQLYMSMVSRLFTSTSTAISNLIRKNKAKLKYSSYVYLIDPDELKDKQQTY